MTSEVWVDKAYNPKGKKKCEFGYKCKYSASFLVGQCEYGDMGQFVHLPGLYTVCGQHLSPAIGLAIAEAK